MISMLTILLLMTGHGHVDDKSRDLEPLLSRAIKWLKFWSLGWWAVEFQTSEPSAVHMRRRNAKTDASWR